MKKRIYSLLLALVMVISLLPVTTLAATGTPTGSGSGYTITFAVSGAQVTDWSTSGTTMNITVSDVTDTTVTVTPTVNGGLRIMSGTPTVDVSGGSGSTSFLVGTNMPVASWTVNLTVDEGTDDGGEGGDETPATLTFTTDLSEGEVAYTVGDAAAALTVAAEQSEGETVSYQWYSNTSADTTSGTAIEGATSASYTPSTEAEGTTYYYAVAACGDLTAVSKAAKITVNAAEDDGEEEPVDPPAEITATTILTGGRKPHSMFGYVDTIIVDQVQVQEYVWVGDKAYVTLHPGTADDAEALLTFKVGGSRAPSMPDATVALTDGKAEKSFTAKASIFGTWNFTIYLSNAGFPPTLASGVSMTGEDSAYVGFVYKLDVSQLFTDPTGNALTYYAKDDDGGYTVLDGGVYSFTPAEVGTKTLVFKANNGKMDSDKTYTLTLNITEPSLYDVTVSVPEGVTPVFYYTEAAEEGTELTSTIEGNAWTVKAPDFISTIAWRADGMGMSAEVSAENNALTLVKTDYVVKAGEQVDSGAVVTVSYGDKTAVGKNNSFLLLSTGTYTVTATASSDYSAGWKNAELTGQTAVSGPVVIELESKDIPITVPYYAEVTVSVASGRQGVGPAAVQPTKSSGPNYAQGTTTYYYNLTNGTVYEYRVSVPEENVKRDQYVTYCGTFKKTEETSLTITADQLEAGDNGRTTIDRDLGTVGGSKATLDNANVADLYMNINAQGYLKLDEGGSYDLMTVRQWWGANGTWFITSSTAQYYFVEPDFHYSVVGLDGQASSSVVTVDDSGKLTAVGEGTAIVLVTYDAMTLDHAENLKFDSLYHDPDGFYGAIWPENTGVFVVSVGAGESGITTGMTINEDKNTGSKTAGKALDAELDVIYFLGEQGTYTFTPGTGDVTVSVANPTVSDAGMSFNGFTALTANEDGSYTVPLTEGRNIVCLEKDGQAEYQVITAKSVSVTVNGKSLEEAVVAPGEKVSVVFDTLYNPVNRMCLYNTAAAIVYGSVSGIEGKAGNTRGGYGYYYFAATPSGQTVDKLVTDGSDDSGYSNSSVTSKGDLVVPVEFEGEYFVLANGAFNVGGFSQYKLGDHRTVLGTAPGNSGSDNMLAYFGMLPDISIPVATLSGIEITAQPTTATYAIGDVFDPAGMVVTAAYSNGAAAEVTDYTYDTAAFTEAGEQEVTISYTHGSKTETAKVTVTVTEVTLEKIEVTAQPTDVEYKVGETFDPTGMEITAAYSDGSTKVVTGWTCDSDPLTAYDIAVTVTYGNAVITVPVVLILVERIAVTTAPVKTAYTEGEYFDPVGMVVTATYSDGTSAVTTDYNYAPVRRLSMGDTAMTISYIGNDAASGLAPVTQGIAVTASSGGSTETPDYDSITVYVSYMDGEIATGADGTLLYNVPVTVYDEDEDGVYTVSNAFAALHEEYYSGGVSGYADTSNGWVNKFWGKGAGALSYALNAGWIYGTSQEIEEDDRVVAFVMQNTENWSDLYTWFSKDSYTAKANQEKTFTVNGVSIMNSGPSGNVTAAPEGATVTVYNSRGAVVSSLTTTTDENGQFTLKFPADGTYTVEVSGTASYSYSGSYDSGTVTDAPVVPSRCEVVVSDSGADDEEEAAVGTGSFTDVADGYWAEDAIRYVFDKGLMNGTTTSTFCPEGTTTRGMIAAILYRLEGSPAVSGEQSFPDVAEGMYCADAVQWAQANGIVNGYSDGTFGPNNAITRQQMAAILYRYAQYKGYDVTAKADLGDFTDADKIDAYALPALQWANAEGLINGKAGNLLDPDGSATRAQVATILMRYLEKASQ